jgi:hypothetical protein
VRRIESRPQRTSRSSRNAENHCRVTRFGSRLVPAPATASDIAGPRARRSHSCMRAVWDHPRNITDDQARACAATGGVVGITGVGIFLGPNTPTLEAMTRRHRGQRPLALCRPAHRSRLLLQWAIQSRGPSWTFSFSRPTFRLRLSRRCHNQSWYCLASGETAWDCFCRSMQFRRHRETPGSSLWLTGGQVVACSNPVSS